MYRSTRQRLKAWIMYRSTRQRLKAYIICLESLPCRPTHNPAHVQRVQETIVETKARNLAKPIHTAAPPLIRERANRSLAAGRTGRRGVCGFPLCTARSQTGARLPSIAFRLERNAKDSSEIEFRPLLLPPSSDTV